MATIKNHKVRAFVGVFLVLMLVLPLAILADNLIPAGDSIATGQQPLALGDICIGSTASGTAWFYINRVGGGQTFANSAVVTVSVDQVSTNVTATMTDATISLPINWVSLSNNTLSQDFAVSKVTVDTTGLALGAYSLLVKYEAVGAKDGSGTVSRPANLAVTFSVVECQACTIDGFFAPVKGLNVVKGGSTVPLKFRVYCNDVEQTDTAIVESFRFGPINCASESKEEYTIETTLDTAGKTELRYDMTEGQFIQNWKTPTTPGCYRVILKVKNGVAPISADFKVR